MPQSTKSQKTTTMNILIIGQDHQVDELTQKLGEQHQYLFPESGEPTEIEIEKADVVFDFSIEESPENLECYAQSQGLPVFVSAAKLCLAELVYMFGEMNCNLFGFNGLPTFLNREVLEVSYLKKSEQEKLENVCKNLGTEIGIVDDRVGMVTPRIICMIINEAYFTVQEGTAGKEDIDQGMKLGTNYPFGPFEWADKIGVDNVYELLEAVYEDTKDERYKICPLLKKEHLLT